MSKYNKTEITLGDKVRFFRERMKMSQMELEVQANLSTGGVSRIENNCVCPGSKTLHRISSVLNLDPKETAYIFGINLYVSEQRSNNFSQNNIVYEQ